MIIHTDVLTLADVRNAMRHANLSWGSTVQTKGSRSHARAFKVTLRGESKRRPNFYSGDDTYAATWDQWGVFLGYLYRLDHAAVCGSVKRPTYADREDFTAKTFGRFVDAGFPLDYHGDHTFRFAGIPMEQRCTKCSAAFTWAPALATV